MPDELPSKASVSISAALCGRSDSHRLAVVPNYSDYLRMNHSLSLEPIALGFDEDWQLSPLFGWQAEALEDVATHGKTGFQLRWRAVGNIE